MSKPNSAVQARGAQIALLLRDSSKQLPWFWPGLPKARMGLLLYAKLTEKDAMSLQVHLLLAQQPSGEDTCAGYVLPVLLC